MTSTKVMSVDEAKSCVDVGIVTMKREELRAVLKRFPREAIASGHLRYNISKFGDASGRAHYAAVVRTPEQGDNPAQAAARSLVDDLKPSLVVLIGIAGAKPEEEFTLGDVIVANRMYDFNVRSANANGTVNYTTRSTPAHSVVQAITANLEADSDEFGAWNSEAAIGFPRPPVELAHRNLVGEDRDWKRQVRSALEPYFGKTGRDRQPIVFDGPIGSGNVLMKDPSVFRQWLDNARDMKAVDMEISGVSEAVRSIEGDIPLVVIRGLSDVIGFKRDGRWTEYACQSAASFCLAMLTSGVLHPYLKAKSKGPIEGSSGVSAPTYARARKRTPVSAEDIQAWLLDSQAKSPGSRQPLFLRDRHGDVYGVLVTRPEYEFLSAAAEIARNLNLLESVRRAPTETVSIEDAFRETEE
jgi:nucleoside phosphorylase